VCPWPSLDRAERDIPLAAPIMRTVGRLSLVFGEGQAKKVTCDCGKTMREPDDDKLIVTVQKHAKDVHNMTLTREQVLAMAEPA
jgi:predicted small metal-binding protein